VTGGGYPLLASPLRIGSLQLRNRTVLSPMTTGFGFEDGRPTQEILDYFAARTGAVGMAVVAFGAVLPGGRVEDRIPWMWLDDAAEALAPLASAIAGQGALPCLQLGHGGRQVSPKVIGEAPVAPSPVPPAVHVDVPPRALSTSEVEEIVEAFGRAAARAAAAGFAAVELHGAHGYLIQQFLSADSNRRQDRFGGATVTERARFLVEVLQTVRSAAADVAVLVRLNGDDFVGGGLNRDDAAQAARIAAANGADAIVVSAGVYGSVPYTIPLLDDAEPTFTDLAAHVRGHVNVPVIAVGRLSRPAVAEAALRRGDCDGVALGRALLADARWVQKALDGRPGDIRPCIATVQGCAGMLQHSEPISCSVNPDVGREGAAPVPRAGDDPARVVVIGGGVAGMEAARRASELGHHVVLAERHHHLGGTVRLAAHTPPLRHLGRLVQWYERQLDGVDVRLGVEADAELARTADLLLVAVGAQTVIPELDGYEHLPAWLVEDLLAERPSSHDTSVLPASVAVLGGGTRALSAALWCAERGSEVTVLATGPIGADTSGLARRALLTRLERAGAPVLRGRPLSLAPDGVRWAGADGAETLLACAGVVLADGARPQRVDGEEVCPAEVVRVGDARAPRDIASAVAEARDAVDAFARARA
jgi:2,4-dienoyl-CoA reductase-like NADH-dependent reductase (Old Yellow Enzyme family)/thioredoxin reductase